MYLVKNLNLPYYIYMYIYVILVINIITIYDKIYSNSAINYNNNNNVLNIRISHLNA